VLNVVGVAELGPVWSVNARDISLGALGTANGWNNVAGTIGARFLVRGSKPIITGRVDASPVRWGRLRFAGTHAASIRFTREEFILRADDGSISATAFRNGPLINLQTLNVALAGAGNVSASGDIDLAKRTLDLDADLENVSADVWPPLVNRYPDISGSLSARGRIGGTIEDPTARFALSWTSLRFRAGGDGYDGEGRLELDPDVAAIRDANWARGYSGEALWHRKERRWEARLGLEEAPPSFIWDVARASGEVSGAITGNIEARGGERLVLRSSFTWVTGHISSFGFDQLGGGLETNGDHITLRGASLVRGSQAIRGQADLVRRGAAWSFDTVAQIQRWGVAPLTIDGEIQAEGKFNPATQAMEAAVTAPVFWIADRSLENFKARLTGSRNSLAIEGLSDERATFRLAYDRGSGRLAGRFRARDLRMKDFFPPGKPPASERMAPPRS
jgi:hypothetical protein